MIAAVHPPLVAPYVSEPMKTFGEVLKPAMGRELKLARKTLTDYNQEEMATVLGWSASQLGKVERGQSPIIDNYTEYMEWLELEPKAFFAAALATAHADMIRSGGALI